MYFSFIILLLVEKEIFELFEGAALFEPNLLRFVAVINELYLSLKVSTKVLTKSLAILTHVPWEDWPPFIYQCILLSRRKRSLMLLLLLKLSSLFRDLNENVKKCERRNVPNDHTAERKKENLENFKRHDVQSTILVHLSFALKQDPVR